LSAEICLPQTLSVSRNHALHFVQNLEIPKSVAQNFDRYRIGMKYQRRWYKICVRGLCGKLLQLKINVRLSAEICLLQTLSVRRKHALHYVQNLEIPKSVARNFDRCGIYMKYQRRWYKIYARGLCGKLLQLKINVRLSAEICLPQRLSARNEHALHFVKNLEIPKSVAWNFYRYGVCMKYQRRWYKICARGLCVKLLKLKINVRLSAEICVEFALRSQHETFPDFGLQPRMTLMTENKSQEGEPKVWCHLLWTSVNWRNTEETKVLQRNGHSLGSMKLKQNEQ